jgi:hypothetical protein
MAKFEDEFKVGRLCFWGQFEEVFEGGIRRCIGEKIRVELEDMFGTN